MDLLSSNDGNNQTKSDASEYSSKDKQCDNKTLETQSSGNRNDDGKDKKNPQFFECQFCSEIVFGIFKFNNHLKKVHKAKIRINCNLCGKKFKRNKEFKYHLKSHESSTQESSANKTSVNGTEKINSEVKFPRKKVKRKTNCRTTRSCSQKSENDKNAKKCLATAAKYRTRTSKITKKLRQPSTISVVEPILSDGNADTADSSQESTYQNDYGCDDNLPEYTSGDESEEPSIKTTSVVTRETFPAVKTPTTDVRECANVTAESGKSCGESSKNGFAGTSVVNPVSQDGISSDVEFLEEVRPPARKRARKQNLSIISDVILFPCPKCDLIFTNPDSAHIHSSFHTLKVNVQFRCLICRQYINNYPEYQRHVATTCKSWQEKTQIPLEFHIDVHSINDSIPIFQCLQCAKTFATRDALRAHHQLNISHTMPAVDPLEINLEHEKCKSIQKKQPDKLRQDTGVERSTTALVQKANVEPPIDNNDIRAESTPILDQVAQISLHSASLLIRPSPSNLSNKLTAARIKPKILETNKRKASRKAAASSVMYHGFQDSMVATNFFKVTFIEPQLTGVASLPQPNAKIAMKPPIQKIETQENYTRIKKQVPKIIQPHNRLLNRVSTTISSNTSPTKKPDKLTCGLLNPSPTNTISNVFPTNRRKASRKEAASSVMYTDFEQSAVFLESQNDESSKNNLYCGRCDKIFTVLYKFKNHMLFHRDKSHYQCGDCGQKFTNEKDYKEHLDVHKGLSQFQCPHCQKCFSSKRPLQRHVKTFHDPKAAEQIFHCTKCSNRYATQNQLVAHLAYHRQKHLFICETCGRRFRQRNEFEMHRRGHLGEEPLQCTLCNQTFSDYRKYRYHIRRHGSDGRPNMRLYANNPKRSVSCNVCSARMSEASYPKHMQMHQPGFKNPFPCSYCDRRLATTASKNRHLLSHPEFTGNICRKCYKELPSKELLKDHESQHRPKAKLICEVCGQCLATRYGLNQHMLRHGTEKPFQCHECGKVFRTRSYLRLHSYVHSQTKRFCCKFCDYRYKLPTLGYTHTLYSHFGPNGFQENDKVNREKTFFCEVCDEGFVKEASLHQHRIYHQETKTIKCRKQDCEEMFFTGYDRSYHTRMVHDKIVCEFCGKDFRLKAELDQHRRYHTGETPFDCHLCDKKYKTKPDLKYHIATHTGDYKFKCEFCEKKFISKANMHAHVRTHTDHKCHKCGVIWGTAKAWKVHKCEGKRLP